MKPWWLVLCCEFFVPPCFHIFCVRLHLVKHEITSHVSSESYLIPCSKKKLENSNMDTQKKDAVHKKHVRHISFQISKGFFWLSTWYTCFFGSGRRYARWLQIFFIVELISGRFRFWPIFLKRVGNHQLEYIHPWKQTEYRKHNHLKMYLLWKKRWLLIVILVSGSVTFTLVKTHDGPVRFLESSLPCL